MGVDLGWVVQFRMVEERKKKDYAKVSIMIDQRNCQMYPQGREHSTNHQSLGGQWGQVGGGVTDSAG